MCIRDSFHHALNGLDYEFRNIRPGVHDTQRYLRILKQALQQRQEHPRYKDIKPLAIDILEHAKNLPGLPNTKLRKVHGDPKINNFLFDANTSKGVCMLDFDTLSNMPIMLELGDAMRSWCNPAGEDETGTFFSLEQFCSALEGYRKS